MDKTKKEDLSLPKGFISPHILAGLDERSSVLVALSGGADSTSLLHLISKCAKKYGFSLYAAHLNHSIRGAEADRDEKFCEELCRRLGVTFFSKKVDVPRLARETKKSVETAARDARYELFDTLMHEHSIPILATAHNANDNLETMIFNLARGCGADGMCGIPACRRFGDGMLTRPILQMSRREILEYCRENSLEFVVDSTNTDTDYTRNKIRAKIIPVLEEINPEVTRSASRLSASMKSDSLCLQSMADWFLEELGEDCSIEVEKLCGSPDAITNRALIALFKEASGGGTLEYTHIEDINKLCRAAVPHSSIDLPCKMTAKIEGGRLYFEKAQERKIDKAPEFSIELREGNNIISDIDCEIFIGNSQKEINIYKNSTLLYLDSAKINGAVFARNRIAGDRILSGKHHKDVRKLIGAAKLPLELRSRLPLLCDGNGILAVPLCATRDGAKSSPDKDGALCVRITFK